MKEHKKSVLDELVDSFRFYKESKKGKYSLNTYLEIIGEYTDRIILQSENEALIYEGGTCTVKNNKLEASFDFIVKMYFKNDDGTNILKEATRSIKKDKFTSETENDVVEELIFEINRPE